MYAPDLKNRTITKLLEVQATQHSVTKEPLLLLVETEEFYNYFNGSINDAEIRINYRVLRPRRVCDSVTHSFVASYQHNDDGGCVVLTAPLSGGRAVFLDPSSIRGSRVGTYLMNQLVGWAKQWPNAAVATITLLSNQAGDGETFHTGRRNRFYEQFNIEFEFADPATKADGHSKPMKARDLIQVTSWDENITEIKTHDYITKQLDSLDTLSRDLETCNQVKADWANRYTQAEKNPGSWFVRALFNKYAPLIGVLAMLFVVGVIGYRLISDLLQWLSSI